MTIKDVQSHLAYNEWANARTFGAVESLADGELTKALGSSFPTILLTAAHIVGAEWIWLVRWQGQSPLGMPDWVSAPSLADVRARLAGVEAERRAFVAALSDADLDRTMEFTLFNGKPGKGVYRAMFMHVVNHSSYHRGQIAGMMRQVGAKPIGTDLMAYAREAQY